MTASRMSLKIAMDVEVVQISVTVVQLISGSSESAACFEWRYCTTKDLNLASVYRKKN
jgi:hypothetical protein